MKKVTLPIALCLSLLLALFSACAAKTVVTPGQYFGLAATRASDVVTEEDLASAVNTALSRYTTTETITGPIQTGDTATIDYVGRQDGVAFSGGTGSTDLVIGSGGFIPGFEDGLIGHSAGETVMLNLTFPETYTNAPQLAGQAVTFEVKINRVTRPTTPELTDAQVQAMSNYATVNEYLTALHTQLEISKSRQMDSDLRDDLWAMIVENSVVENYPEEDLSSALSQIHNDYSSAAAAQGVDMYSYVASAYGQTQSDFDSQLSSMAEETTKARLVLHEIAGLEGITISDAEYTAGLSSFEAIYSSYTQSEIVEAFGGESLLRDQLLWEKLMDLVVENAIITQE